MWLVVLVYVVPAGVTLYGVMVLLTGEVTGFRNRSVRGAGARVLGVILVAALPLAIVLGPSVRIQPLVPKPDLDSRSRDVEITQEIIEQNRLFDEWREKNQPNRPNLEDKPGDVEQITRAANEYSAKVEEYDAKLKQRKGERDLRVRELEVERDGLRQERKDRQQAQVDDHGGALWVALGVMLGVWALATLMGRVPARSTPQAEEGRAEEDGTVPTPDKQSEA